MEIYTINDWNSGTYTLSLPASAKIIEIYDANGKLISDSYNVKITSYGQLQLDYENYAGSAWPLKVVTFSGTGTNSDLALFDQPGSAPAYTSRFAIGKRHELAKNVNFRELSKYINDDGAIVISKDFTGFNYGLARDNLSVYSTDEVDDLASQLMLMRGSWRYPAIGAGDKIIQVPPFIRGSSQNDTATGKFVSTYDGDVFKINVSIRTNGVNLMKQDFCEICSLAEATGQEGYFPQQTVIAYPKYKNEFGWPITAYKYHNASNTGEQMDVDNLLYLPPLVLTNGSTNFGSHRLPLEKYLYLIPTWKQSPHGQWNKFINGSITLEYELMFYPANS